jgi:hypothetical protein
MEKLRAIMSPSPAPESPHGSRGKLSPKPSQNGYKQIELEGIDEVEGHFAASILHLKRHESFVDYTGEIEWTRADRTCLSSLNDMHYMSRHHHATMSAFEKYPASSLALGGRYGSPRQDEVVALMLLCCDDPSTSSNRLSEATTIPAPANTTASDFATAFSTPFPAAPADEASSSKNTLKPVSFQQVQYRHFSTALREAVVPSTGVLWIHLKSDKCIPQICQRFSIHGGLALCFTDKRAHSSLVEGKDSFLLSLCGYNIDRSTSRVVNTKLFIYAAEGLVITYELDLIPPIETEAPSNSSRGFIFDAVACNLEHAYPLYCKQGVGYLIFDLLTANLELQNSLLKFCYRCVLCHKQRLFSMSERDSAIVNTLMHCKVGVL